MKQQTFLLITAIASFVFGAMMFFAPGFTASILHIETTAQTISVLRGLGGLIIGSGLINFFLRNQCNNKNVAKGILLTNIATHLLGLSADIWGAFDGALTITNMLPVEATHLFVAIGSLFYILQFNDK